MSRTALVGLFALLLGTSPALADGVSLDHIAKVAGLLERMAQQTLPPRPVKKLRGARR